MNTNQILDQFYRMSGTASELAPKIAKMFGEDAREVLAVLREDEAENTAASERMNPQPKKTPRTCHYCGQPAQKRDFFGELVCNNCQ